jgi:hypothetical protein
MLTAGKALLHQSPYCSSEELFVPPCHVSTGSGVGPSGLVYSRVQTSAGIARAAEEPVQKAWVRKGYKQLPELCCWWC